MPILFATGMFILLGLISFATYRTSQIFENEAPEENPLLSSGESFVRPVLIAISIGLGLLSKVGVQLLGWVTAEPLLDMLLGLGAGVGIALVLFLPSLLVRKYKPQWYNDTVIESIRPRARREWPLVIFALLPMAVLEELIFRSLLLGGFEPHVKIIYFAIAASIFFGVLHKPQGEWGVVAVTLVGLSLSALFLWRHSLLLVISAHWIANVMQLFLVQLVPPQVANAD